MSPSHRRAAVAYLVRRHPVSERRVCRLPEQHRSTQRYVPQPPDLERQLVKRMNQIAPEHPRYGYRMVCTVLCDEGFEVNPKRVNRLWRLEGHQVPRWRGTQGKRAQGKSGNAVWNLRAIRPNQIWSYDFVMTRTDDGLPVRILNVVDEFSRVAVACRVARSLGTMLPSGVAATRLLAFLIHAKGSSGPPGPTPSVRQVAPARLSCRLPGRRGNSNFRLPRWG